MAPATNVYTHGHHESVLRSHRWRTAANSAAYLLPHLVPGMSLLDVGCGPGTITVDLATRVAPGQVTAVEITNDALHLARTEASSYGQRNIDFAVADIHALDFPDGTFDVTHAHQVLQHVADPVRALREMRRVSRPGGIVAARDSDYAAFTWCPRIPALDEWLALYQHAARANGASRMPAGVCSPGPAPPGSPTSRRRRAPGASPAAGSAVVGRHVGRADPAFGPSPPVGDRGRRHARRPTPRLGGLEAVGRRGRRLVRRPTR
jgi:SAM-dependent methyltransferase